MDEFKHKDSCNNQTKIEISGVKQMEYCDQCGVYIISDAPCEHTFIFIGSVLSNKTIQLRQYCTKCNISPGKTFKHSEANMDRIQKRTHDEIRDHNYKIESESRNGFSSLIESLDQKRHEASQGWYGEYLKSEHWSMKKEIIMRRDNRKCQICGEPAIDIHHLTYVHVQNEYDFELVALCRKCHLTEY